MSASITSLRRFGSLLLVVAGTAGCAQPSDSSWASPTAPSSLSAGSSALSAPVAQFGPGASYDASGPWHVVMTERPNAPGVEFDIVLTQDGDGNLTFTDDTGALFTFTRRGPGTGRMIPYDLSAYGPIVLPNSPCETNVSGAAQLDTQTDTIWIRHFSGIEDDCEEVSGSATLTRN